MDCPDDGLRSTYGTFSTLARLGDASGGIKQGQSFPAVVFWEIGIVIWLIYGLLKNDKVIVVSNCIGVCAGLLYLAAIMKYS